MPGFSVRGFNVRYFMGSLTMLAGLSALAPHAMAQSRWPQIGAADLGACRAEISEFHKREIAFITKSNADYCAQETVTPAECQRMKDGISQTVNMSDIAWFMKGNGSCEMSDYPCFGPQLYNDDRSRDPDGGQHWLGIFREQANTNASAPSGFGEYYDVVQGCVAKVFMAKYDEANRPAGQTGDVAGGRVTSDAGMSRMAGDADGNADETGTDSASDQAGADQAGPNPNAAQNTAGGDGDEQQVASLPSAVAGNGAGVAGDPAAAARCKEALAAQDAEFGAMNKRGQSVDGTKFGTRALFQLGMYIMDERMKVLDASCKGQPEYAQYAGAKKSYDSAKNSCAQVSTDNGETCVPLKLW